MTYFKLIEKTPQTVLMAIAVAINAVILTFAMAGMHIAFDVARSYVNEHFNKQPEAQQQPAPQPTDTKGACHVLLMRGEQLFRHVRTSRMRT